MLVFEALCFTVGLSTIAALKFESDAWNPSEHKLLSNMLPPSTVQENFPEGEARQTACRSVILAHYHKTGCAYSSRVSSVLHATLGWEQKGWENWTGHQTMWGKIYKGWYDANPENGTKLSARTVVTVSNPSDSLEIPDNACVVHWYRDPRSLLLSSYRYHSSKLYAEPWEFENRTCHRCDARSLHHIFGRCPSETDNCTYFDVLKAAESEQEGLEIDAVMEKKMISTMMGNLKRWANDPRVLHLSVDHLRTDTEATTRCLLNFLEPKNSSQGALFRRLKGLPETHPTHGSYNNTHLLDFLENHMAWGRQLKASRRGPAKIFRRQRDMYGCPVPEL